MRDRSIPRIVNCSGRFMSELLKTRIEQFYPGGLDSGSYIEKWRLPGGKHRIRRTPAEEIISLSNTDNKIGIVPSTLYMRDIGLICSGTIAPLSISLNNLRFSRSCTFSMSNIADSDRPRDRCNPLGKHPCRTSHSAPHPRSRSQFLHPRPIPRRLLQRQHHQNTPHKPQPPSRDLNLALALQRRRMRAIRAKSTNDIQFTTLETR